MQIEEGAAKIEIPAAPVEKGPGTRGPGFFNPSQRINRDITIAFLSAVKPSRFLDAFGGSGIRGIRVSKETGLETVISEINPSSYKIALENVARNEVDVQVYNESFERTLERQLFDFIDIDPYGSVIPFIDKALTGVKNRGYVGATATDLSSLTGSVPAKTRRRYDAYIKTDAFKHEMGLRLLIAYVVKRAAANDIGATPELSFWHSHFYRVIFRVEQGAARADSALSMVKTLNKHSMLSGIYKDLEEGPVWTGNFSSPDTLRKMVRSPVSAVADPSKELLEKLQFEDDSIMFLELTDVARNLHSNMPPILEVRNVLRDEGIETQRTHFSQTGLKVNGSMNRAYEIASSLMLRYTHNILKK